MGGEGRTAAAILLGWAGRAALFAAGLVVHAALGAILPHALSLGLTAAFGSGFAGAVSAIGAAAFALGYVATVAARLALGMSAWGG